MKILMKYLIISIIINSMIVSVYIINTFLIPNPVNTPVNLDITYEDPMGDVESGEDQVSGNKDIDIIKLKSYKSNDNRYLILELKVAGKIKNSPDVEYYFDLLGFVEEDDAFIEEDVYDITYNNGVCSGSSYHDDRIEYFNANIRNSNTLVIKIPLEKLPLKYFEHTLEFRISAHAMESKKEEYYIDYCDWDSWGGLINIIEPFCGATVSGNYTIKGFIHFNDFFNSIKSVEVQIDSQSPTGWKFASTTDNWSTWSYYWETNSIPDGKHKIYIRAFNGDMYQFAKISVHVNNYPAINPKTAKAPKYHSGDFNYYQHGAPVLEIPNINGTDYKPSYFFEGNFYGHIIGLEIVNISETNSKVYIQNWKFEFKDWDYEKHIPLTANINKTSLLRYSDLAPLKLKINVTRTDENGEFVQKYLLICTYEYPNGYVMYPLIIGNKWENNIIEHVTEFTNTSEGKSDMKNFTLNYSIEYKCIRIDTIKVLVGEFDVFVILCHLNYSLFYGYRNGEYNGSDYNWELFDKYISHENYYLFYYSPEIGYPVKVEEYFYGGRPDLPSELISYKYGTKSYEVKFENSTVNQFDEKFLIFIYILTSTNTILLSTIFITGTEVGKYSFFKAIVPFFAKHKKKRNYEHGYIKGSVRGVIYGNPGENYSAIKKILGLPNGTLTYYLKALEKEGVVRSERDGFLKRFYPAGEKESTELLELTDIQKNICKIIKNNPGISQKDIGSKLSISQQRLNYHIQLMVKARLIKVEHEGKITKCFTIKEVF